MTSPSATATRRGDFVSFALARATIVIGGFSFANLAVGLVRGKVSALLLGAAGVGVLSQANNFVQAAAVLCTLGFAAGITNRLAAHAKKNKNQIGFSVASTAFTVQLIATAVFILFAVVLFRSLYFVVFATPGVEWSFLLIVIALPLVVMPVGVVDPVFFGVGRYDLYTKAAVTSVMLSLPPFLVLSYFWGLNGAMVSTVVAAALKLFAFLHYSKRLGPVGRLFHFQIDVAAMRHLFGFGWTTFIVAVAAGVVSLFIRSKILHDLGATENGLYQVPVAFSAYCAPFLTNGLWGHLYPYVSGRSAPEVQLEVQRALRMNIVTATILVFGFLLLQEWAIALVFSQEFVAAARFLPIQLFGDVFYFPAFTLTIVLLGLGRLKEYVGVWLGYHLLQGGLLFVLLPMFGLAGAALGYTISALVFLVLAWSAYTIQTEGPTMGADVRWLLGTSATLLFAEVVITLVWSTHWWLRLIPLACWLSFMTRRPESTELLAWSISRAEQLRRKFERRGHTSR